MRAQSGRSYLRSLSVFVIVPAVLVALAGCAPAPIPIQSTPPAPTAACAPIQVSNDVGLTSVQLPDGSELELHGDAQVQITMAGCGGAAEGYILLDHGEVAIRVGSGLGASFVLAGPDGIIGRSQGLAIVSYQPDGKISKLECVSGACQVGADPQNFIPLTGGEGGEMDSTGNVNAPTGLDLGALYADFGAWLGIPAPATATPDLAATATSGCATFDAQFPSTPCP